MHPWHRARQGDRAIVTEREKKDRGRKQKENATMILLCTRSAYKTAASTERASAFFFTSELIAGRGDKRPICRRPRLLSTKPTAIALSINDGTLR